MRQRQTIYLLTLLAAAMSLGHHLDHVIRGNAVGWPLTPEVNAFTISLGIYPVLATGLLLTWRGWVGPGFWALLSGGGAAFVSAVHFGPLAVEPPELIHAGHETAAVGWIAFAWLIGFVGVLMLTCVYETRAWDIERRTRDSASAPLAEATRS